eukprot:3477532-Pleurochrysis_carterae.AAC.2
MHALAARARGTASKFTLSRSFLPLTRHAPPPVVASRPHLHARFAAFARGATQSRGGVGCRAAPPPAHRRCRARRAQRRECGRRDRGAAARHRARRLEPRESRPISTHL